jgi:choline dehydrogenase-like flavoprotein
VDAVDVQGDVASSVLYRLDGREEAVKGEFVAVGANAIFNANILLRSGLEHPALGKYLHEQASISMDVFLDGVKNFDGSTSITGLGYMFYDGDHRRDRGAILFEHYNKPKLRPEFGRWTEFLRMRAIVESLPLEESTVRLNPDDPTRPLIHYAGHGDYAEKALQRLDKDLGALFEGMPVERWKIKPMVNPTESHMMGTTRFGDDPATSVLDRHLLHHRVRNLAVLGSSCYPTSPPANPSLTISALSLWSADHVYSSGGAG